MAERGWDQSKLRAQIKATCDDEISSGALVKYLYCDRRPGVRWTIVFQRVLGVEPGAWLRDPEGPFALPAAKGQAA